ncbi:MarR family winged helix-turn-helix transcriptional regulator [Evansella sp. AB-rgal1]|uniref:MarR family winged helix-turn-helix transcriptional regulator n=1 Tax=Evansella sp. AB-rgal1 TaxID=3242696 RepID=UPI00359E9DF4
MRNRKIENIASFFLSFFPVIKKKIFPPVDNLHKKEISPTHFAILMLLEEAGKLPTTEIGKRLLILKSNLTPLINKLIAKDLVEREAADHDRRIMYIQLTDHGRQFLKSEINALHKDVEKRLEDLDEDDINKLYDAIKTINEVMKKL